MDIKDAFALAAIRNRDIDARWGLIITTLKLLKPKDVIYDEEDGWAVDGDSEFVSLCEWARYESDY